MSVQVGRRSNCVIADEENGGRAMRVLRFRTNRVAIGRGLFLKRRHNSGKLRQFDSARHFFFRVLAGQCDGELSEMSCVVLDDDHVVAV